MLYGLAYGIQMLRQETGAISRITLTVGAAQSAAVCQIAPAVFGLPIATTEVFESVAVGAAKQAAWALTGVVPEWSVPYLSQREPSIAEVASAEEITERYRAVLADHYGVRGLG